MKRNDEIEIYVKELQQAHDHWTETYLHGCSDPTYEDGTNLNLIRNHILCYRKKIEETMSPDNFPEIWRKEVPPEVDMRYMARSDEIRAAAKVALEKYKADPNYQYIMEHRHDFTTKTQELFSVDGVIGYVKGLEYYIKSDKLVDMRRHEHFERYLRAFEECTSKMREKPIEQKQISLFSLFD